MRWFSALSVLGLAAIGLTQVNPADYSCLKWRFVGPFRGGRTVGIDSIWSKPNVWYIGVNNGGVWKTDDYGRTWKPVFDDQPTGSIGSLAVAQSNPDTVYVGTGEGLQRPDLSVGNGIYKTTNGGKSWAHIGLDDAEQTSGLAVDPHNPDRVFAAVLGHPYGPNHTRGLYRSLDGGKTWQPVLQKDDNTGAVAVAIDPDDPNTVYCSLWAARQAPWENGDWQGPECGLFKSTDGGDTWHQLKAGLPTAATHLGRIGFTVCRSNNHRLYACVDADNGGIFRSDDAGESWRCVSTDKRLWGRGGDFAEVRVDPSDPDMMYIANTSIYKTSDGGATFNCIKGAPGGDDYHTIWVHPTDSSLIGFASDQGAAISVNSGDTWSSWYNQPTAQMYHVSTDNHVPYRIYGGQQESGSVGILSRGPDGQITFRDWHPVGAEEYAYVAPDPLDPDLIYGNKGSKFDWTTGLTLDCRPTIPGLRYLRTMPMLFSPVDPHALYQASNQLLVTNDGAKTWASISPDLSRDKWDVPPSFAGVSDEGKTMKRRGVIYAVSPSPRKKDLIWCGTDDGLVWITQDAGKTWANITPPGLTSWSKVSQIDAGHFNDGEAYVSVNRLRCDDLKAYIYHTTDFGITWTLVSGGLPDQPVNAVREDPNVAGLIYAATETQVWYSEDSGRRWNSLRENMPASSIRDLVVKDDDLVIGTHGRGFWVMDGVNLLRHPKDNLVVPKWQWEFESNSNTDTPLPPDEPVGQNPPDGVPLDYRLDAPAKHIVLTVTDKDGKVVRTYDSDKPEPPIDPAKITVDPRWARPPVRLGLEAGSHRLVWDFRTEGKNPGLSMQAVWNSTPGFRGDLVPPGVYKVQLVVDGKTSTGQVELKAVPGGFSNRRRRGSDDD